MRAGGVRGTRGELQALFAAFLGSGGARRGRSLTGRARLAAGSLDLCGMAGAAWPAFPIARRSAGGAVTRRSAAGVGTTAISSAAAAAAARASVTRWFHAATLYKPAAEAPNQCSRATRAAFVDKHQERQ